MENKSKKLKSIADFTYPVYHRVSNSPSQLGIDNLLSKFINYDVHFKVDLSLVLEPINSNLEIRPRAPSAHDHWSIISRLSSDQKITRYNYWMFSIVSKKKKKGIIAVTLFYFEHEREALFDPHVCRYRNSIRNKLISFSEHDTVFTSQQVIRFREKLLDRAVGRIKCNYFSHRRKYDRKLYRHEFIESSPGSSRPIRNYSDPFIKVLLTQSYSLIRFINQSIRV